jgi:formate hydrogenlyase subunit 4
MIDLRPLLPPLLAVTLSPLLLGIVARTKAIVGGRRGPPLLQLYFDLAKLLRKGAVYSRTTTWLFRAGPIAALAGALLAAAIVPFASVPALLGFDGDLVALTGVLALLRFATALAALDTGSAFEGMGASREVEFASFAEPALLLALAALARATQGFSLTTMSAAVTPDLWLANGPALTLLAATLAIVHLAENCRIPVDDPATHLELTMIHEVMVLDHGGPDLALILGAAAVKFWVLGSLIVNLVVPVRSGAWPLDVGAALLGMAAVAVATGLVEATMARLRLVRIPQLLVAASSLAALGAILTLRGGAGS